MTVMKDVFSIRSSDLDQCRALLVTMAKDLAASNIDKHLMIPGAKGLSQQHLQELKQLSLQQQQQRQAQQAGRMAP